MRKIRKSIAVLMSFMMMFYSVPSFSSSGVGESTSVNKIELSNDALESAIGAGGNIVATVNDWVNEGDLVRVSIENNLGLGELRYVITAYDTAGTLLETVATGAFNKLYLTPFVATKSGWRMVKVEVYYGSLLVAADSSYRKGTWGAAVSNDLSVYVTEWRETPGERQAEVRIINRTPFSFNYSIVGTDINGNVTETFLTGTHKGTYGALEVSTINPTNPNTKIIVANGVVYQLLLSAGASSVKRDY
jgi:hypothetical protein